MFFATLGQGRGLPAREDREFDKSNEKLIGHLLTLDVVKLWSPDCLYTLHKTSSVRICSRPTGACVIHSAHRSALYSSTCSIRAYNSRRRSHRKFNLAYCSSVATLSHAVDFRVEQVVHGSTPRGKVNAARQDTR